MRKEFSKTFERKTWNLKYSFRDNLKRFGCKIFYKKVLKLKIPSDIEGVNYFLCNFFHRFKGFPGSWCVDQNGNTIEGSLVQPTISCEKSECPKADCKKHNWTQIYSQNTPLSSFESCKLGAVYNFSKIYQNKQQF